MKVVEGKVMLFMDFTRNKYLPDCKKCEKIDHMPYCSEYLSFLKFCIT